MTQHFIQNVASFFCLCYHSRISKKIMRSVPLFSSNILTHFLNKKRLHSNEWNLDTSALKLFLSMLQF